MYSEKRRLARNIKKNIYVWENKWSLKKLMFSESEKKNVYIMEKEIKSLSDYENKKNYK